MLDTSYYEPYDCCYKGQAGPNQYEIYESGSFCEGVCFFVARILIARAGFAEVNVDVGAVASDAEFGVFHWLLLSSDNSIIQYDVLVCQVLKVIEKKEPP